MAQWIGCMVSIKCFEKGTYQGEILNATNSKITLGKVFCDGIPCDSTEVTILLVMFYILSACSKCLFKVVSVKPL